MSYTNDIDTARMRMVKDDMIECAYLATHHDGCIYTHWQCAIAALCDALDEARARIAEHDEEIRQFNDGFKAGERGDPEEQPHYDTDYDTWMCGYAWGAFDGLKARIAEQYDACDALEESFTRLQKELEARIAELEAALADLEEIDDGNDYSMPDLDVMWKGE